MGAVTRSCYWKQWQRPVLVKVLPDPLLTEEQFSYTPVKAEEALKQIAVRGVSPHY